MKFGPDLFQIQLGATPMLGAQYSLFQMAQSTDLIIPWNGPKSTLIWELRSGTPGRSFPISFHASLRRNCDFSLKGKKDSTFINSDRLLAISQKGPLVDH